MKRLLVESTLVATLALSGCDQPAGAPSTAGPNGGDVVPITVASTGGTAWAELLANADTGELAVHTWDKELQSKQPIEDEPIIIGSGEDSVELMPHPATADPPGTSSRFYGQAEWVKGGGIRYGWLHREGAQDHREFNWQRCWQAGRTHAPMWTEMRQHHGMGRGPGHRMGPGMGPRPGFDSQGEHGPDAEIHRGGSL